jgi:outer membrane protein assembly factor BamB
VNATSNNVWAFDNLYPTIPGSSTACTNGGSDGGRCTSPYCPRRIWTASLSGRLERSSLTLSLDGTAVYAATTNGVLYALDTATGAELWKLDTRTSAELGSSSGATFLATSPWVDYASGNIYVAASYGTNFRMYKISPAGTVMARLDVAGDRVESSAVVWQGAVYVGTTSGRVYKLIDNGTSMARATSPWPVQLFAKDRSGNNYVDVRGPIYGTPSIDVDTDVLAVTVNNVMWTVNLTTGAKQSVEGGWQTPSEADANNVPCYSSPWIDPWTHTMFVAHGKNQNTPEAEQNRVHRREYLSSGAFRTDNLTSVATAGVGNPVSLSDPRSSPLVLRQSDSLAWVFVGDAGGILNRWDYRTNFSNRQTFNTGLGPANAIESPIMVDVMGGYIYFGSNAGRVYQISQSTLR